MANRSPSEDGQGRWRRSLCVFALALLPTAVRAQTQEPAQAREASAGPSATRHDTPARDEKIAGFAVIIKVDPVAGQPVFEADGYRVRIATSPEALVTFAGGLKTLADVEPNTRIRFECARDETGEVVARTAQFFPSGSRRMLTAIGPKKAKREPDYQPVTRGSLLDADGHLVSARTKVRYSDAGGPCGWHRVPADAALQERVRRVGMRVVPEYQKLLPQDAASRIPFRFYVVGEDKVRSAFACNEGMILVPENVLARLGNDDQLAAVLAEAVAFNLKRQLVTVTPTQLGSSVGAEAATMIPILFPAGYIAGESVIEILNYKQQVRVRRDCARIALQLMADSGYDPWQAPEAWRLLAPKEAPKDAGSLVYTPEGKYQLSILKIQYKKTGTCTGAASH